MASDKTDGKAKTPRRTAAQRAELGLNSAQGDVDKLVKRLDSLDSKIADMQMQRAELSEDVRSATQRRDYALSNPDLSEDARTAGTPGPTGADTPQNVVRDFATIEPLSV